MVQCRGAKVEWFPLQMMAMVALLQWISRKQWVIGWTAAALLKTLLDCNCISLHWSALKCTVFHWVTLHCKLGELPALLNCNVLLRCTVFHCAQNLTELHCIAYWVNWRHCWKLYWIAMQLYFIELNIYCSALHVGWSGELVLLKAPLGTLALVMHCSALIQYNTFLWCIEALNTLPGAV